MTFQERADRAMIAVMHGDWRDTNRNIEIYAVWNMAALWEQTLN